MSRAQVQAPGASEGPCPAPPGAPRLPAPGFLGRRAGPASSRNAPGLPACPCRLCLCIPRVSSGPSLCPAPESQVPPWRALAQCVRAGLRVPVCVGGRVCLPVNNLVLRQLTCGSGLLFSRSRPATSSHLRSLEAGGPWEADARAESDGGGATEGWRGEAGLLGVGREEGQPTAAEVASSSGRTPQEHCAASDWPSSVYCWRLRWRRERRLISLQGYHSPRSPPL